MKKRQQPPPWIDKFLHCRLPEEQFEEVQGDMHELYNHWIEEMGERKANRMYLLNALTFLRPLPKPEASFHSDIRTYSQANLFDMIRNYLTIALRNMDRHKVYSFINISGLAVGMAVAMLIGLWIYDEFAFNTYHTNQDRIVTVMQNLSNNGEVQTLESVPYPLAEELRSKYGGDFKHVALAMSDVWNVLLYKNNTFTKQGTYFEPQAIDMLSVKLVKGNARCLNEPASIILCVTLAQSLFKHTDPLNKIIQLDDTIAVKVTGVYEDFPSNSNFHEVAFIAPWQLYYNLHPWVKELANPWRVNAFQIYAQVNEKADIAKITLK